VNESLDLPQILGAWNIPRPIHITRPGRGTNNLTWRLDTEIGSFVLRIYQNVGNLAHVAYEHALLRALAALNPSFAVPAPLLTHAGSDTVLIRLEPYETVASLVPLIAGHHPHPATATETESAGAALGELDELFRAVSLPANLPQFPTYGQIRHVHPLVPDPFHTIEALSSDRAQRSGFQAFLAEVESTVPTLYADLPRQIIHSDMGRSSVLIDGTHATGILDFEFASPDLRVMDFAVGALQFSIAQESPGISMESIEVYAQGYAQEARLESREIEALPALWRLRQAVSVVHRLGRFLQGASAEPEVMERIEETLLLDRWLHEHGMELVARVAASMNP
jgi:homoserine kinase type II